MCMNVYMFVYVNVDVYVYIFIHPTLLDSWNYLGPNSWIFANPFLYVPGSSRSVRQSCAEIHQENLPNVTEILHI